MLDSVMIGYVCFHEDNGNYDLGFCFHSDYQGNGYAYESCTAIIEYMEKERGVKVFTAGTALKNAPPVNCLKSSALIWRAPKRSRSIRIKTEMTSPLRMEFFGKRSEKPCIAKNL